MIQKMFVLLLLLISSTIASGTTWTDNFNYFDSAVWSQDYRKSDPTEKQTYTSGNVYVGNGDLIISTKKDWFGRYTSGRINSDYKKYFSPPCKIEVRAKMPQGKGMWPAIWLMAASEHTVRWPDCGEIDIAEMFGGPMNKGDYTSVATAHWASYGMYRSQSWWYTTPTKLSAGYHLYQLDWQMDKMVFKVDNNPYLTIDIRDKPAFKKPFYMILNTAVGNSWLGYPDYTVMFPQYTYIDYVKYTK